MSSQTRSKVENIYQTLAERIFGGTWKVGDCLPTELELAEEFDCGRNTISKAVTRLAHEGLVERKKRAGTHVLPFAHKTEPSAVELDAVAFLCPSEQHEGIWRIMKGFQQAAAARNRRTLILTTGSDHNKELEIVGRLSEFAVQGVALHGLGPASENEVPLFMQRFNEASLPMIQAGIGFLGLRLPSIIVDGFHASHTMVRYLRYRGVKRIGFFDVSTTTPPWVSPRYQGFRWTMAEVGLKEDPQLVYMRESANFNYDDPSAESHAFAHDYLEQVKDMGLQAVVCGMDYWALGLIQAARERGLSVPGDLMVTGLDDYLCAANAPVPLTTYRVPFEKMGRISFEILEKMIASGKWRNDMTQIQVRGELVIRESA